MGKGGGILRMHGYHLAVCPGILWMKPWDKEFDALLGCCWECRLKIRDKMLRFRDSLPPQWIRRILYWEPLHLLWYCGG